MAVDILESDDPRVLSGITALADTMRLKPNNPFGLDDNNFRITSDIANFALTEGYTPEELRLIAANLGQATLTLPSKS